MTSPPESLAGAIDACLPQTQCGRCGYAGCRPYAEAIADGTADINRCPPGGDVTTAEIAALLGTTPKPLADDLEPMPRTRAVVVEARCIGCTLCIQACPVDAITGSAKLMHTVIADECTGCELCLPVCPVDCIDMIGLPPHPDVAARRRAADLARTRFEARLSRLPRMATRVLRRRRSATTLSPEEKKRRTISEAMARAKARLGS